MTKAEAIALLKWEHGSGWSAAVTYPSWWTSCYWWPSLPRRRRQRRLAITMLRRGFDRQANYHARAMRG